jgi:hypothetical protein
MPTTIFSAAFEAEVDASQERNGWTDEQTAVHKNHALVLADSLVNFAGFDADDSDQAGQPFHEDVMQALAFAMLRIGLDDAEGLIL